MTPLTRMFGLLMDASRQRILMLLDGQELCVSELMAVLQMPQPLVSRNLSLLAKAGLLDARRQGKRIFYRLRGSLPEPMASLMELLRKEMAGDETHIRDMQSLRECVEYERNAGKCSMKTFLQFMKRGQTNLKTKLEASGIDLARQAFSPGRP